jgi:hypothetical protein
MRTRVLDANQTAEVYRIAPHAAPTVIQQHLEIVQRCIQAQTAAVDLAIKHYEYAMQFLPSATDEPTYQTWRTFAATVMSSTDMGLIPVNYSAEWVKHMLANRRLRTK